MGPSGPAPNSGDGLGVMCFDRAGWGTYSRKILRKSDERFSRKSTLNFSLRNPLYANKERIRTRYDSDVKSSTLGVIRLAGMSLPGNGAVGDVTAAIRRAKYRKKEHLDYYFRFD